MFAGNGIFLFVFICFLSFPFSRRMPSKLKGCCWGGPSTIEDTQAHRRVYCAIDERTQGPARCSPRATTMTSVENNAWISLFLSSGQNKSFFFHKGWQLKSRKITAGKRRNSVSPFDGPPPTFAVFFLFLSLSGFRVFFLLFFFFLPSPRLDKES